VIDEPSAVPVWVNGKRCENAGRAAEQAGRLLGRRVDAAWISRFCGAPGRTINGVTVSTEPPGGAEGRKPLLRYPPGERPMERGLCPVRH
jgi:hypothetical protein